MVYSGLVCPSSILFTPNEKNGRFFFVLLCIPILLHLRKASQTKTFFIYKKHRDINANLCLVFIFFQVTRKHFWSIEFCNCYAIYGLVKLHALIVAKKLQFSEVVYIYKGKTLSNGKIMTYIDP